MSDEQTQADGAGDHAEEQGFSAFSDTEVTCDTCGMNIVRDGAQMDDHRDFHAAAAADTLDPDGS
jgi:hypothetical protein